MKFTSALVESFPGHVQVFSKRQTDFAREKHFYPPSKYLSYRMPGRVRNFLDIQFGQFLANKFSDIYYSPYYGKIKTSIPQVFTAHDMIYEKFPNYYPGLYEKKFIIEKKECFERAAIILCISQSTEKDIRELYPNLSESKFRVVYNGVDDFFRSQNSMPYNGKPYFLYVGNRFFYKNFLRLLTAFGESNLSRYFCMRVISPTYDFPTDQEKEIIEKYQLIEDVHVEISVSDAVLHERYQQAFAYVYPSEYEGFGLPLLEAMASGTLVLASNTSSLPEIGSDIPLYFDPLSIDAMVQALRSASSLPDSERQKRIEKGKSRSLLFSWQSSQKNFLDAIVALL